MKKVATKITEKMIQHKIIAESDKDIYLYGFWQGIVFIINMIGVLIVGLILDMLWQSIVFTLVYGCLRIFAGGYHARTQKNCYILSLILIIAALSIIKYVHWNELLCVVSSIFSGLVIFVLAPVEDENKRLDEQEKIVYKKRARIIFLLLSLISMISLITGQLHITVCFTISILASAIMVILGKMKNVSVRSKN
jgi:accessory gene regulator B